MTLKENTLRDSRVLDTGLKDVNSVIFEVVVDSALAETVVLSGTFNNWLLEEGSEIKDLKMESVI